MGVTSFVGASPTARALPWTRQRVFDPLDTLFAILVDWFFRGCARVRLEAHVGLYVRPLIGRAAGLRGSDVLYVSFGSDL